MPKIMYYLMLLLLVISIMQLTIVYSYQEKHFASSANDSIGNWSVVEQVFYLRNGAEVFSGMDRIGANLVMGVGTDQTPTPDVSCIFAYYLGDTQPRRLNCRYTDGVGLYDAYSPWRNGSALVVGWRDPMSGKPSGIFVYRYDYEADELVPLIAMDDPDFESETMTWIIGFNNYVVTSGKVTGTGRMPAIYVFKYEDNDWKLVHRITNLGAIILRNDDTDGNPRIYTARIENNTAKIYRINLETGDYEEAGEVEGSLLTVFRSTLVVGKDVLGVTDKDTGVIKLWSPDRGVFYQHKLQHGFDGVSIRGSHYGSNYALVYGRNVVNQWKGPVYMTDLKNTDRKFGGIDWRLKWTDMAPILITKSYAVISTARGLGDTALAVYNIKTTRQAQPTTTTTRSTTTTQNIEESTITTGTTGNHITGTTTPPTTTNNQGKEGSTTPEATSPETKTPYGQGGDNGSFVIGASIIIATVLVLLFYYFVIRKR